VKFLKGGANFLNGGEIPRTFAPQGGDIPRTFAPQRGEIVGGGENPGTPDETITVKLLYTLMF
jgi:hypothetical protein